MLKNYLTITLRNLWRHKLHTAINVVGLAIGISACIVIYLIVDFELGVDAFRQDRERIYRIYSQFSGSFDGTNSGVVAALPAFVEDNFSGLETVSPFHVFGAPVSAVDGDGREKKLKYQGDLVIAGPEYFQLFPDYQWIAGSPEALASPNQVVLTDRKARLYFEVDNPADAIGREVRYQDSLTLTVAGILADPGKQTDLYFQDFISFSTIRNSWLKERVILDNWSNTNSSSQLFIKLAPGIAAADIDEQLLQANDRYNREDGNAGWDWTVAYHLEPFTDLHFSTELGTFDHGRSAAHRPTLYALILLALMLVLIAAINFINLETAQSVNRSKEVGVRKVMGSRRRDLTLQFLGETLLVTLLGLVVSLAMVELTLRYFDEFIPDGVVFNPLNPLTLGFLALLLLVVTVLAGAYPAFVLSSFRPVQALRDFVSERRSTTRTAVLRKGLIVVQFVFAQILIFGTFILGQQIKFMVEKDLGFNQEAIIYFYTPWQAAADKKFVLASELERLPGVEALCMNADPPATPGYSTSIMRFEKDGEVTNHNVHRKFGDTSYVSFFGLDLVAGRNVHPSDTVREFVINETLARQLGFTEPEQALGQHLIFSDRPVPIVGVVRDFHVRSLHHVIPPVAIADDNRSKGSISLRLSTVDRRISDFSAILGEVQEVWEKIYPEEKLDYHFLDDSMRKLYESEQRTAKLVRTATAVAILISCLGLLGLISFLTSQRTREIGIRKVLGASVSSIVLLLTREFLWLVLAAALVALPLAWYATSRWLKTFAYTIEIEWWMFMVVVLAALAIALLTVSLQALQAARANPVESLRREG